MKAYDDGYRMLAASCWVEANKDTKTAARDFLTRIKHLGSTPPRDAASYVARWGQYWEDHQHVKGNASNSGRKRKLADEDAAQLADDLINYSQFEVEGPFTSIKQLKRTSPRAKAILEAAAVHNSTVTRAVKRAEPNLSYEEQDIKQKLRPRQRQARYSTAQHHKQVPHKRLSCVVFVDAKVIYCTVKRRKAWVPRSRAVPFETKRPKSKSKPWQLKYYIGVGARAGKVFIKLVTGTTGWQPPRAYRVSVVAGSSFVQHPFLVGCCTVDGQLDCLAPTPAAALAVAWHQPHHLKTLCCRPCCQCPVPRRHSCCVSQAHPTAVLTCVWRTIMQLPLNCNQHPARLQQHNVPPVCPQIHPYPLKLNCALHCMYFNCIAAYAWHAVKQPVCFLFIPTPLACAHPALQRTQGPAHRVGCLDSPMLVVSM